MRAKPTSRRTRARIAIALCALWVASFEVLPWLHVALHDHAGAHTHDAAGTIVRVSFTSSHGHPDDDDVDAQVDEAAAHERGYHVVADHAKPRAPDDDNTRIAAALAHGRHSLAHHGIALPLPAPAIESPLPIDRMALALEVVAVLAPRSLDPLAAACRGPPEGMT